MNFKQKLDKRIKNVNSCVCVGLDSKYEKIPTFLKDKYKSKQEIIFQFNKQIIDQTYDLVCAYKPNIAFYEAEGNQGLTALKKTIEYIRKVDKEILTIVDAKRADIGNTNLAYIKSIFEYFKFDAVTVHPYLGKEALSPFLNMKDKGIIILCRTSNSGAGKIQDLEIHSEYGNLPLYKFLAYQVKKYWNKNSNCCLVVGATYPKELAEIRKIVNNMPLLIPGIGAQGGDIQKTVKAGKDSNGRGMIINSSRSIIFASEEKDFAKTARIKTKELENKINKYRN